MNGSTNALNRSLPREESNGFGSTSQKSASDVPDPAPLATMVSVLIADDHPVVRFGVKNLLMADGRFSVLYESETTADTVQRTVSLLPDILLMDLRMPDGSALAALNTLRQQAPSVRVVMLTAEVSPADAAQTFLAGARGLLMKSALGESISTALLAVYEGAFWAHGRRMESREDIIKKYSQASELPATQSFNLTRRELEVVGLIVKGHSNREIAQQFKLSEETVKRHLSNIFDKVGISTRLELAILAIDQKLAARP